VRPHALIDDVGELSWAAGTLTPGGGRMKPKMKFWRPSGR
jgi:hypothetical protein